MEAYGRSREIDKLCMEGELELKDFKKVIPSKYLQASEWRSWFCVFRVLTCVALCQYLLFCIEIQWGMSLLWQLPLLCCLWFLYGAVLLGFFLIGHDCGHGSFSRYKWVNNIVGTLCMAPIFNGFRTWTLTHNHHHIFTQIRGEDVDWSSHLVTEEEYQRLSWRKDFAIKLGYTIPFGIFWWIMWNALQRGSQVKPMLQKKIYERNKNALRFSNLFMFATTIAIYWAFWHHLGFWGMLKQHHIPISIGSILGGVMVSVGHANFNSLWYDRQNWSPLRGQLVSTYDYRFPSWLEYLVLNINIHIPHHISVRIPWYYLKPAAKSIQKAYPEYYQELPFRFREMSWIVWAPFIKHNKELGQYHMQIS